MRPNPRFLSILTLIAALGCLLPAGANAAAIKFLTGSYITDLSASAPIGLTPATGVTLPYPSSSIRMRWLPVAGTSKYQIQIARQSSDTASCAASTAFQADNVVVAATTDTNEWVPTLADAANGVKLWTGTYCWRVRSFGSTPGLWSGANRFTRTWSSVPTGLRFYNDHDGPIPRVGTETDFATGSTSTRNTGYSTWTPVAGAASYSIQVGTSQSFSPSSIIASRDGIRDNKALMLHLPDDTYFWRVRAIAPNGTEGGWSAGSNAFTVLWYDPAWSNPAKLFPADNVTMPEMRIGWTPMPGASYYEYQIGTSSGCFWDPSNPAAAPDAYGDWVNYAPIFDTNDPPNLVSTADPQASQCRLSPVGASTMNNWVTLPDAWDSQVFSNISHDCVATDGAVLCEPAGIPDSTPDDWGSMFHGLGETPGGQTDGRYGNAYEIWWQVRPVYKLKPDTENGWNVSREVSIYGSWSSAKRFDLDPSSAAYSQTGTRCPGSPDPVFGNTNPSAGSNKCLKHIGSTMRADQPAGVADASTMQVPLLQWEPFAATTGGYVIQIARDPAFNNIAKTVYQPGVKSIGYGFQSSYAMTDGLPDNSEGTGYWWRVVPCRSTRPAPGAALTNCVPHYNQASAGLPIGQSPGPNFADSAVAQTFVKRTTMQTIVVPNFEGAAPLIKWTIDGVPTSDYAAWARGVEGAEHYELQLARDPFFSTDPVVIKTTIARAVPFKVSGTNGTTSELDDGLWYYRVRAIDRNGLEGSWSEVSSFNKRITGPAQDIAGGGPSTGAGVTIAWSPITGASDYTVQWTTDETFESAPNEATTRQTSYHVSNVKPGVYFWRVRANVNGIAGQWTAGSSPLTVTASTTLGYALSKPVTVANSKLLIYGQLKIAGTPTSGRTILLQKKSVGCDANGSYTRIATAVSGKGNDDGVVAFTQLARTNGCYRLAYVDGSVVYFSVPIAVKVQPVVKYRQLNSRVRRGSSYCLQISSNTPVTGRLRLQYKSGRTWFTTRTVPVNAMRSRRQCAAITKAGNFSIRIVLDTMYAGAGSNRWRQFEDTTVSGGTVRVNDKFTIKR